MSFFWTRSCPCSASLTCSFLFCRFSLPRTHRQRTVTVERSRAQISVKFEKLLVWRLNLEDMSACRMDLSSRVNCWLGSGLGMICDLNLRNVDVAFSVRFESPNHINIEEGVALLKYLKWVLRST